MFLVANLLFVHLHVESDDSAGRKSAETFSKSSTNRLSQPLLANDSANTTLPDWLAEQMISTTVDRPLDQRVLDPACGSGTFLFHACRRYLNAAEEVERPLKEALAGLT
ncbi:MAG: hypothetical protein R3C02_14290 [Planctomycetaceae bacterium]